MIFTIKLQTPVFFSLPLASYGDGYFIEIRQTRFAELVLASNMLGQMFTVSRITLYNIPILFLKQSLGKLQSH